jgi:hypothetical protein
MLDKRGWPIWQVTDTRADPAEHPHFMSDRFEAYLYSSAQRRPHWIL